jgi:hypothetical protein
LSWPARLVLVALAVVVGWMWNEAPVGIQISHVLQYGLLLAVSIVASCWYWVAIPNFVLSVLWYVTSRDSRDDPSNHEHWRWSEYVTWANRLVGNVEALATWIAIALVTYTSFWWQVTGLAVIALLGTKIINGIAQWGWFRCDWKDAPQTAMSARLLIQSEPVIYAAAAVGLFILVFFVGAAAQWRTAVPLCLTLLPALLVRWLRARKRRRRQHREPHFAVIRAARAVRLNETARRTSWMGIALTAVGFAGVVGASAWGRHALSVSARSKLDGPAPPAQRCEAERGGPTSPLLSVFLIADTHINELRGKRFSGQMAIADAIMPVARRPIELDILSAAPMRHFMRVYSDLNQRLCPDQVRGGAPCPVTWAHLGDFANLSCTYEMKRALELIRPFSRPGAEPTTAHPLGVYPSLAGFAPGSHDMSFHGNFDWSPYWDIACHTDEDSTDKSAAYAPPQRMDKEVLEPLLAGMLKDRGTTLDKSVDVRGMDWTRLSPDRALARFTLSRLGTLPKPAGQAGERGVLGLFIDTADRGDRNFGIAGAFGSFSWRQAEKIVEEVDAFKCRAHEKKAAAWTDPWIVVFKHTPYRELRDKDPLDWLITNLDNPGPSKACNDLPASRGIGRARVLAMLAAHTHTASAHRHCINKRLIREIVIGSTLDPPQEAALLEVGYDEHNHAALRVSTVPAMERPGYTCSSHHGLLAARCRDLVAGMATQEVCSDLVGDLYGQEKSTVACGDLERPLSLAEKVQGIVEYGGPDDDREIKKLERQRGRALIRCICRDSAEAEVCKQALAQPLDDQAIAALLDKLSKDDAKLDELTCLSWAASAVQQHKARGMTMADALRCAFDDPALQPAQVTTASSEVTSCF